ncbi:MAG: Gfo/Idh/MocA family oxidoreductase [Firmicutes bacterium]|nr:Gfo/Idh/MocA family oxidoreductase [Bacillota bacterium]
MKENLNILMLSKWHVHAAGYAAQLKSAGRVNITAVWDEEPERGKQWAGELGAAFESDLAKAVARADVDAVVCDAPTTMHREVLTAAANAGKHIFTEKALAPTLAECREIAGAVQRAGVKFVISMPHRNKPVYGYAKQLMDDGSLGVVSYARLRNAHGGASANWLPAYWYDESKAAGGAMMDLGCHPMYLAAYLLGRPKRVAALFNSLTSKSVDDNAVGMIEFANGAVATVETGFVTPYSPNYFEVYGTEGSLIVHDADAKVKSSKLDWARDWASVPESAMPPVPASPIEQFVNACLDGAPIAFGMDEAISLTELLEGAYIANKTNTQVLF